MSDECVQQESLLETTVLPLGESAFSSDGSILVKVIQPGWGSSAYYSEAYLRANASKYAAGTHMHWDHPTKTELKERPERSLKSLAAVFISEGQYLPDGPYGSGVYARAKPTRAYREAIKDLAPYIGVSHFVLGRTRPGEADGRKGPIAESLDHVVSVDFVTVPGAGGKAVAMYESFRDLPASESDLSLQESAMEWNTLTFESLKENRPDLVSTIGYCWEAGKATNTGTSNRYVPSTTGTVWVPEGSSYTVSWPPHVPTPPAPHQVNPMVESEPKVTPLTLESLKSGHADLVEALKTEFMTEIRESEATKAAAAAAETQAAKLAEAEKTIETLTAELDRFRTAQALAEAKTFVSGKVAAAELPEIAKTRLVESLTRNAPLKEGKFDADAYSPVIDAAILAETEFVAAVLKTAPAAPASPVRGMGQSTPAPLAESRKIDLYQVFLDLGMSEAEAKVAAGQE